eukprot:scaffold784_cov229-Ochromonas_danica.AAC.3
MSVVWCLPRDVLHSVYSEWLEWKDLSRLDIACVGKSGREVWLSSSTDLRVLKGFSSVSDDKMAMFYKWLGSRKVFCVNEFVAKLDDLELLVAVLDMESLCPVLQSR